MFRLWFSIGRCFTTTATSMVNIPSAIENSPHKAGLDTASNDCGILELFAEHSQRVDSNQQAVASYLSAGRTKISPGFSSTHAAKHVGVVYLCVMYNGEHAGNTVSESNSNSKRHACIWYPKYNNHVLTVCYVYDSSMRRLRYTCSASFGHFPNPNASTILPG